MPIFAFEVLSVDGAFAICFWVGLVFAIISGVMSGVFGGSHADSPHIGGDIGGDAGGHADAGAGHGDAAGGHVDGGGHGLPDFPAIGPVTISTFATVFGGTGMIFRGIPVASHPALSVLLATGSAFTGGYLVYLLFAKVIYGMQASSEVLQHTLIGQSATVTTSIPADGTGEIVYTGGSGRQNAPARSTEGQPIPTGTEVQITKVVGGSFYVKRKEPTDVSSPSSTK